MWEKAEKKGNFYGQKESYKFLQAKRILQIFTGRKKSLLGAERIICHNVRTIFVTDLQILLINHK
jgi:hypothetical protein